MKTLLFVSVLTLALPQAAVAQSDSVWRCGADGRSYSATPCAEGRALEPIVMPSAADRQAAHRTAGSEMRLAEQMRKDRLRREAETQRNALAGFRTTPPGPPVKTGSARAAKQRPPEASGTWRAIAPPTRRARG